MLPTKIKTPKTYPINFTPDMIDSYRYRAKCQTRTIIKPQPNYAIMSVSGLMTSNEPIMVEDGIIYANRGVTSRYPYWIDDILWVREKWCNVNKPGVEPDYFYYADAIHYEAYDPKEYIWASSSQMPREAARFFLRVTGLRTQRIQDMTLKDFLAEGIKLSYAEKQDLSLAFVNARQRVAMEWDKRFADPKPVRKNGEIVGYESFPWEDVREERTYRGKPWRVMGNPWVVVTEFTGVCKPVDWFEVR